MSIVLFAGPSLVAGAPMPPGARLLPPAARGDVAAVITNREPGTLVLADGVFDHEYAVGHRELMMASAEGWRLIGVASMGAIRASELRTEGMEGFGAAYEYLQNESAPDDHLAVVHEPSPTFRIVAEALFDIRSLLQQTITESELESCEVYCREVASWWFADRTRPRLMSALSRYVGQERATALLSPLQDRTYRRAKQVDLANLLKELADVS